MKLAQILSLLKAKYTLCNVTNIDLINIESIETDSRLVKKNSVFFALSGKENDGSKFIDDALKSGASLVVCSNLSQFTAQNFPAIITENPFELLVEFLQIFYSPLPANIYAITGTNGKTSVAEFTRQILQFLGKKSASIGTLGVVCDREIEDYLQISSLTTPDLVSLYKNLCALKKFNIDDVAIEVSSIGLEQKRVAGLDIKIGAFTNFTQDHLDYHGSMSEYFRCKMILFEKILPPKSAAIFNADIPQAEEIRKICQRNNHQILDYGFLAQDLKLQKIEQLEFGQKVFFEFRQKEYEFELFVGGDFQAMNALCALGNVLSKNNLNEDELRKLLKNFPQLQPALGRMQRAAILPNKAQIFIDFAHTPDALVNVLQLGRKISQLQKSNLIVLFGCGGDRDPKKRPIMGKIACDLADIVIVTDDNPRTERAELIRAEILAACNLQKVIEISGRKEAIKRAISRLKPNDILILAGKGHEKYQIIGTQKIHFDELEIVREAIDEV